MAEAWNGEVSDRTIGKALRKIGFTRKKKLTATLERDEDKRQDFQAKISQKTPEQLVYIDEAGMVTREDYGY